MKNNKKKRVQKACELLSILKKLKPNQCQELFLNFSNNGIEFFCEIIYNLINAKFSMSKQKKLILRKKFKKHLPQLRKLSKKANSEKDIRKKRKIFNQKGGGVIIPLIASTVGPLLIDLIRKQFSKK